MISENELKKDYHIPKRKKEETCIETESKSENDQYNINQTPLANSYYNYTYDASVASTYYGNYSQYYAHYTGCKCNNINFIVTLYIYQLQIILMEKVIAISLLYLLLLFNRVL